MFKKLFSVLILFVFTQFCLSQIANRDFKTMVSVKITKEDGTEAIGKMKGIYFPSTDSYRGMIAQSNTMWSVFPSNLYFEFTPVNATDIEKIPFNDLKKINVLDHFDDGIIGYEKLKIKEFDKNMNKRDKNYEAFLPILYEGKINIYGYDYIVNTALNFTLNLVIYIKKEDSPYAFMPIDYDRIAQFAFSSNNERFIKSFREIGNDCQNFQKYLDDLQVKMSAKGYAKIFYEDWNKDMNLFEANAKKQNLKGGTRRLAKQRAQHDFYMKPFLGIVKEYEKNCK